MTAMMSQDAALESKREALALLQGPRAVSGLTESLVIPAPGQR
jgi:hypothetical protein